MLQQGAGAGGRSPSSTWALGTRTGPGQNQNQYWDQQPHLGWDWEASAHQEGFVILPPMDKAKVWFYFGTQNNQGFLFYCAHRGNVLRGCSRTPQLPAKSHKKRGIVALELLQEQGVGAGSS